MRPLISLLLLLCSSHVFSQTEAISNHKLYEGSLAIVTIDRALYEIEGSDAFYFKINISNISEHPIGVEADDYWGVLYVSQWVIHKSGKTVDVLEHQYEPEQLTARVRDHIIWKFRMDKMVKLQPGETFSYYRKYDNGLKKDLEIHFGEVASFLIDGQLFVTNGKSIEDINIIDEETVDRQLDIPYPIEFFVIPKDGRILVEDADTGY